jgi:hypothetical protein
VNRSSRAVKGKRKVVTKKARVKRRAVPERMRFKRGVEEVTHGAGYYGTSGSCDNAGSQAGEAVALATNAAPKMNDQSGRSDPPHRPDTVAGTTPIYPQATATGFGGIIPARLKHDLFGGCRTIERYAIREGAESQTL